AHLTLHCAQQLAAAVFEHFLQLVVAACLCRCFRLRRRRHDDCRSFAPFPTVDRPLHDVGGYAISVPLSSKLSAGRYRRAMNEIPRTNLLPTPRLTSGAPMIYAY